MSKQDTVEELPDDIEVIGPGQMLADAREAMGLTQQQVAEKLNFRNSLVRDIENEVFDKSLPDTFNRGYLKNYAKLVNISAEQVLASYETLNIAQQQGAEMQSFSKQTEKQAETHRLMWISYLILALLIAATVVWWMQNTEQAKPIQPTTSEQIDQAKVTTAEATEEQQEQAPAEPEQAQQDQAQAATEDTVSLAETLKQPVEGSATVEDSDTNEQSGLESLPQVAETSAEQVVEQALDSSPASDEVAAQSVEFTFSGDCWVNIYDATGERVAWGIKKSGYVMNITGQPPFTITLGKPELVSIVYQQQSVDMSQFSQGNIAKFTLPLE